MKKLSILLATILVAIGVALTYYYFEWAVHSSITYIWDTWLATETHRWLVPPLCLILTLAFFGVQHFIDKRDEQHESQGLGDEPQPTIRNFGRVLLLGFLSLLAGASLGPEAILVPACMMLGSYVGVKLFKKSSPLPKLLAAAGFMALCTAFFNSFIVGLLSVLLVTKQAKIKLSPQLVVIAVVASATAIITLNLLDSTAYAVLPAHSWHVSLLGILLLVGLGLAGYGVTHGIGYGHAIFERLHQLVKHRAWWLRGLVAAAGLSALYLLGGPLVEFTGNRSIVPMLEQAASLGVLGLTWVLVIKLAAISWSKALGYRGGLIFPTIFVASILVALAQVVMPNLSFIFGLLAVMIGVLAADRRVKILL